jgi:predicted permease
MMLETFFSSFFVMLDAVGRIFLIIIAAGFLVRKKVITQEQVKSMATITVNILLPCMLFSSISGSFDPQTMPNWWLLPLACVAMMSFGVALGFLFFPKNFKEKQHLFPLAGMQNAIYLVLPIGRFMYPDEFDNYSVLNFLYIIGFTPMAWSIGKIMVTGQSFRNIKLSDFLTPPLIASVGTVLLVLLNLNQYVPKLVFDSIELVGEATIPISNIVLGATLGGISLKVWPSFADLFRITLIKYLFIPVATILVLHAIGLKESHPLMANMLIIESAAAPATALILQVRSYGGDKQTIGSMMLILYALCLFTIPFWNAVWQMV